MKKDKKMDKIIFFDIDGTLYSPETGIPRSTIHALKKLSKNGHKMVMCTGRSRGMVPDTFFHLGFDGMIAGAGTYVEYQGKVLYREMLTEEEVKKVIDFGRKENLGIILEGDRHGYYDPMNQQDYYLKARKRIEMECETTLVPLEEAVDIPKWTYRNLDKDKKKEAEQLMDGKFKGVYHEPLHAVEFIPSNGNKAKGIERILKHTGLSKENAYAFGDSVNDLDMIKYVKYGIAMGNAVPELLEIAPYHTARIEEDGIEKGLKQFGLIE